MRFVELRMHEAEARTGCCDLRMIAIGEREAFGERVRVTANRRDRLGLTKARRHAPIFFSVGARPQGAQHHRET